MKAVLCGVVPWSPDLSPSPEHKCELVKGWCEPGPERGRS